MISNIRIENYKSITNLPMELGRVNVLIGENGAGKSNILEAIALAGAAAARKLDNEFLVSRGVRVVRPVDMRPAFEGSDASSAISVEVAAADGGRVGYSIENDNQPYSKWTSRDDVFSRLTRRELVAGMQALVDSVDVAGIDSVTDADEAMALLQTVLKVAETLKKVPKTPTTESEPPSLSQFSDLLSPESSSLFDALLKPEDRTLRRALSQFVTYSPENSALRTLQREGQIEPLGINGEGVLKLYSFYVNQASGATTDKEAKQRAQSVLDSLHKALRMLGWFDGLRLAKDPTEETLEVRDLYIEEDERYFEFGSANEGFFFLLFYFLLFSSELTPPFFAIDNIDASLNPALCRTLIGELADLARKHDKQVILTTHNPAILDGLNLDDEEQRLFVVSRSLDGETRAERISKPRESEELRHLKMSELFMRGLIGGLPKTF